MNTMASKCGPSTCHVSIIENHFQRPRKAIVSEYRSVSPALTMLDGVRETLKKAQKLSEVHPSIRTEAKIW